MDTCWEEKGTGGKRHEREEGRKGKRRSVEIKQDKESKKKKEHNKKERTMKRERSEGKEDRRGRKGT